MLGLTRLAFRRSNFKQTSKFVQDVKKKGSQAAECPRVLVLVRLFVFLSVISPSTVAQESALCGTSHVGGSRASGERRNGG